MRVLVTDGDNRAALAITRSLGIRGHHVVVADRRIPSLAQMSRFCAARVQYPDPTRHEAGFLDAIVSAIREHQIDVLLPVSDVTTLLVTKNRDQFPSSCHLPFASHALIARAADKADMVRLAMRLGVPVPRTIFLETPAALGDVEPQLSYPVVVKPHRSRVPTQDRWLSTFVRYAFDQSGLVSEISRRHPLEFPLLLQEHITGPGVGIFLCYDRGKPIARFSHRRLREKPPSGGVSVLSESVAAAPRAREYADALLGELGWHGVAMVEFKQDQRDGDLKLMEINGRFWGSLQLAIDSGVDFPGILLDVVCGHAPASPPSYRVGVRSRWLWGDLDSLLLTLQARGQTWAGRRRAVGQFLRVGDKNLHYENPRWSDLRPWLYESASWFRSLSARHD